MNKSAKVVLGCVHPQLAAEEKWGIVELEVRRDD